MMDDIEFIEFDLTSICNLDCPLCFGRKENLKKHMPFTDTLKDNMKKLTNLKTIRFCGVNGEPFLYKHIKEFLTFICTELPNVKVSIATGGLIPDMNLKKLLPKNHEIDIAIDGSTQEINDITRPSKTKNHLNIIDKKIKELYKNGININLIFTAYEHNEHDYEDFSNKYKHINHYKRETRYTSSKFKSPINKSLKYTVFNIKEITDKNFEAFKKISKFNEMYKRALYIDFNGDITCCNEFTKFDFYRNKNITINPFNKLEDLELENMCKYFQKNGDRRQCIITCGFERI